ncbi:MAG: hypothetical protein ACXVRJ_02735 [Gaiellaceae bacterium]
MRSVFLLLGVVILGALVPAASARRTAAPIVQVVGAGSTARGVGTSQTFSYGIVLRNGSASKDALRVQVRVAVVGPVGLIGIYLTTIPLIPAGATFYLGNEPDLSGPQRATGVRVAVAVAGTQRRQQALPPVSGGISQQGAIAGRLTNPYGSAIDTASSKLFAVYYDRRGKILGGDRLTGVRFPHRLIAAKKSATFVARLGGTVSRTSISRIRFSVIPGLVKR